MNQYRRQMPAKRRRGAMMILILIMLIGFLVTVAFSVDIALMHLSRTELRTATDAASKAAAQELASTQDEGLAIARGKEIAALNLVNNDPLLLSNSNFEFGNSSESVSGQFVFDENAIPTNSVRVQGRRTADSLSGPIPLFFGNILGLEFFEPEIQAAAAFIERDVVLVVDRSGSMRGAKFADLRSAIDVFVDTLDDTSVNEFVGLASYNSQATEDVELTPNLTEITNGMNSLPIGGFTSISRGMRAGEQVMSRGRSINFVERTMIVMTDGRHNRGPEPRTVATDLANAGVQIHTITFGAGADIARMREVADIGRGEHFHALTGAQLRDIYREIALSLGTVLTE